MLRSKKTLLVSTITIFAFCVLVIVLFRALFCAPSDDISLPASVSANAEKIANQELNQESDTVTSQNILSTYPTQLSIPKLNIHAKIGELGITKKGNMTAPTNFTDVGWYKYGTLPGDVGSAVIAGHLDDGLALPAVFINLKNLNKGDDIYVTLSNNKTLHFVVTRTDTYDSDAIVPAVFNENDGKFLKLITCSGDWIAQYKTHNQRLVVTATLV